MPNLRHALRWFLRRRLRRVRRNLRVTPGELREILYLFSGTYGDMVQILRPLDVLAKAAPGARIRVLAPVTLFEAFRPFLPATAECLDYFQALRHCRRGADLVLTNAVGVYRTRFEILACLGGRMALGFRHAEEKSRRSYTATLPLTPAVRNFEACNLALLRLAGIAVPEAPPLPAFSAGGKAAKILFHVGSAGFKESLGIEPYVSLIRSVLGVVGDRCEEIVYGPGDAAVQARLNPEAGKIRFAAYPLPELAERFRNHAGTIVCFNSFCAHFCRYLRRPAVVIHYGKVPYGYDCDPPHRQIVLPAGEPWNLDPLRQALQAP